LGSGGSGKIKTMRIAEKTKRVFWIQTVAVLLVVGLIIAGLVYLVSKPLDAEALSIAAGDLRSLSSAGAQLSAESDAGNLTGAYFRNQIELMHDNLASIRDELDESEPESAIRDSLEKVRGLAAKVEAEFDTLPAEQSHEARIRELERLAIQLRQIEEDLKRGAKK
jgi:hypothetical protein